MSKIFSRRDFLKLAGAGTATAAVLTGCGPASRYVVRRPYASMPEYNQTGISTYYATTCRECPAGCGIIVRTMEGRAIKVEGNPNHPVSRGKVCSTGLTAVQGLYNPDRVTGPVHQDRNGGSREEISWDAAVEAVRNALSSTPPDQLGLLVGLNSDSFHDLASEYAAAVGAYPPARFGAAGMLDGRDTLKAAAGAVFGSPVVPFFDLANADVVFAFGDILNTWVSPVAYTRAYGAMRQARETRRGYLVCFEPAMSQTGANADEWIPVIPGSEGLVARALAGLATGAAGMADLAGVSQQSGVDAETLTRLAEMFTAASHPLAVPGSGSLAHTGGQAAAEAILSLNLLPGTAGQAGGLQIPAASPLDQAEPGNPAVTPLAIDETKIEALLERMNSGQVKTLFIHGVNPVFELPAGYNFSAALDKVPLVISFASFPDETSQKADYILPDHTGLESWGYQKELWGADRPAVSAAQPVVAPLHNTRSSADVLLAAQNALPYTDVVDYLQKKLAPLVGQAGSIDAADVPNFWAQWLQTGGWWATTPGQDGPAGSPGGEVGNATAPAQLAGGEYYLATQGTNLGDGSGANRPWLQETPHPLTTVMWNSWVQIHPETAAKLGVTDDDVVKLSSQAGEVEAVVYLFPAIRPDTVAVPFGQGHTALGQFAAGRGFNPAGLMGAEINEASGQTYGDVRVRITPTGKKQPIARLESKAGVYGEEFKK